MRSDLWQREYILTASGKEVGRRVPADIIQGLEFVGDLGDGGCDDLADCVRSDGIWEVSLSIRTVLSRATQKTASIKDAVMVTSLRPLG